MPAPAGAGLVVAAADSDADLEAMIDVRAHVDPDLPPPRLENLRHALASALDLTFLVARDRGRPVGCGFVQIVEAPFVEAHVAVVPAARRQGVGSELLAEVSRRAAAAGKTELEGELRADDTASRRYFERRGYRRVGGEQAVALDLVEHEPEPVEVPPGVRIVTRADHPDLLDGMYAVAREADEDIPGSTGVRSFQAFRAVDIDRPTRRADLCFVALAGDEVIGYAILEDLGAEAYHGLTAVRRPWRRRGVASALKRAQIATAKERGFTRLVTESEDRNAPMRKLNLKLGYRPAPALSTVVLRGPLLL